MTMMLTMADVERLRAIAASDASHVSLEMDEETFRGFYERTSRVLWSYLARLSDRTEADDLLQETYYRFLRARGRYESEAHRRNALFAIATNVARDRSRRRRVDPVALAAHADAPVREEPPGTMSASLDQRHDLSRAMRALRPRERGLLWLAYVHGWSHREIAGALGLRVGSVKPLLFRARTKLASVLRRERAGGRP